MMCDWVVLLIVRAEGKICFTTQTSFPWEINKWWYREMSAVFSGYI